MAQATDQLLIRFMADASQYLSTVNHVQRRTEQMAGSIQKNLQKMSIAFSALGAFRFGQRIITEFSKFDEEMVRASAVLDTHTLMQERMRRSALDLAGEVAQSPAELARAYYDLGQAGKTANQAIKALPVFTKFATAANMKLADSVRLLTDVQYAMGMSADTAAGDEAALARISDVLTKAAIMSKAEVQDFAEALSNTSAGTLKVFNKDLEAGVALLSVYADQGRRGAVAGTSLTRVMLLLSAAAVKHEKAFEKKGLKIFDEKGELKSFSAVIENLSDILGAVPVAERQGLLQALGIKSLSQNALLPLVNTEEAVKEYEQALKSAKGTMEEVANKTLKSFANQVRMVWNLFTVLSIEIGERLAPGIAYIKSVTQELVNIWKGLNEETKTWIAYAVLAGLAISVVGTGLALLGMILPGLLATGSALWSIFMSMAAPVLHLLHLSTMWAMLWMPIMFTSKALLFVLIRLVNPLALIYSLTGLIRLGWMAIIALFTFSFSPMFTLLATLFKIAAVVAILVIDAGGVSQAWNQAKQALIDFWVWIKPVRQAIVSFATTVWEVAVKAFIEMGHHAIESFKGILEWLGVFELDWTSTLTFVRDFFRDVFLFMEYSVRNFGEVWNIVSLSAQLAMIIIGAEIWHFFTVTIPTITSWFMNHWHEVFYDIGSFTIQFVKELGEKIGIGIGNAWAMAMGYDVDWSEFLTPMMKDWESAITELPTVPTREIGKWEKDTREQLGQALNTVEEGFSEFKKKKLGEFSVEISDAYFYDEDEEKKKQKKRGGELGDEFTKGFKDRIKTQDATLFFSAEGLSRIREFMEQAQNIREGRGATEDKGVSSRDAALKDTPEAIDRENENLEVLKDIRDGVQGLNKKKPEIALDFGALTGSL